MWATWKSIVAKGMTAGLLGGALLLGAPKKAEAQQFTIGVQIGHPIAYPAPPVYYARPRYYDRMRWEQARRAEFARQDWLRRQAWLRHEQWVRAHRYGPDPYAYYYGR